METPSQLQLEAIKELINIGIGKGAAVLNAVLSSHVQLRVPSIRLLPFDDFRDEMAAQNTGSLSAVDLKFKGAFSGSTQLVFPSDTAISLVKKLAGDESGGMSFDTIRAGTLCEIGNIVLNGVMGSISNILKLHFDYSVPEYLEDTPTGLFRRHDNSTTAMVLLARTRFLVEDLNLNGDIILFFEMTAIDRLLRAVDAL